MKFRIHWAWIVPVLLITTFLGTVLLTYDALWFDEWVTYFITNTGQMGHNPNYFGQSTVRGTICGDLLNPNTFTPIHMICMAAIDNSWPPVFFGLMMMWDFVSGGAYYIDRTLALFVGLIAIAVTYQMAATLFNKRVGLISVLLLGTSVFFTFYLHEIRGYTLYVLMPALNGWLYWRLLRKPAAGRTLSWGFALSIVGTLYTHYVGIGVVFGIGLYHVLFERPKNLLQELRAEEQSETTKHWLRILKLYINACLTYGLWVAILYIAFVNESLTDRSVGTLNLLWTMVNGFSNNLWFIALPMISLTLVRWKTREIQFLWTWGLSILFVAIMANIFADFLFHPRHIIGMMPLFVTLVAVGLVIVGGRTSFVLTFGLIGVWILAGFWYGLSTDFMNAIPQHIDAVPRSSMETIVATAEQCASKTDTFIMGWNIPEEEWVQDHIVTYYLHEYPLEGVTISRILNNETAEMHPSHLMPEDILLAGTDVRYNYFVEDADRVFLFILPDIPIGESVEQMRNLLEEDGFVRCEFIERNDLYADIYVRDGNPEMCEIIIESCTQN